MSMMAMLPAALSFIGGERANSANIDMQNSANATNIALAEKNNKFNAEQYATRYQVQNADLKKAGLNPALAYSQGAGQPIAATPARVEPARVRDTMSPAASTYLQGQMNSAQVANVMADTENKKAQSALIAAQAAHYQSSASLNTKNLDRVDAEVQKIGAQIPNINEDTKRLKYVQQQLAESAALMAQQGQSEVVRRHHLESIIANLHRDGIIKDADIKAINDTGGIGRIAREIKPATDIGGDLINPLKFFKGKK